MLQLQDELPADLFDCRRFEVVLALLAQLDAAAGKFVGIEKMKLCKLFIPAK
jgi:hypothetical protein